MPYANKKIREVWRNMVNTTYSSTDDMINELQELKGKTKLGYYRNRGNYYNEKKNRNFQTQGDPSAKNARGMSEIYHEKILLMKFLQTKPQVKNMNIDYYNLYYTVIKTRVEKEIVDHKYENDYISLNDVIIPNHYVGIKR